MPRRDRRPRPDLGAHPARPARRRPARRPFQRPRPRHAATSPAGAQPFGETDWQRRPRGLAGVLARAGGRAAAPRSRAARPPCSSPPTARWRSARCPRWHAAIPDVAGAVARRPLRLRHARDQHHRVSRLHEPGRRDRRLVGGAGRAAAPSAVVLAGVRGELDEFDGAGRAAADASPVTVIPPSPDAGGRVLAALGDAPVYVHFDPDVLDPSENPVPYAPPGRARARRGRRAAAGALPARPRGRRRDHRLPHRRPPARARGAGRRAGRVRATVAGLTVDTPPPDTDALELVCTLIGEPLYVATDDSGFAIRRAEFEVDGESTPRQVRIKGGLAHAAAGETLTCQGRWVDDHRYGWQFDVGSYVAQTPVTADGVATWLQTRLKGVGPVFAESIVRHFTADGSDPDAVFASTSPSRRPRRPRRASRRSPGGWSARPSTRAFGARPARPRSARRPAPSWCRRRG